MKRFIAIELTPRMSIHDLADIRAAFSEEELNPIFWEETVSCLREGGATCIQLMADTAKMESLQIPLFPRLIDEEVLANGFCAYKIEGIEA